MEDKEKEMFEDEFDFDNAVLFNDTPQGKSKTETQEVGEEDEVEGDAGIEDDTNTYSSSDTAADTNTEDTSLEDTTGQPKGEKDKAKWIALGKFFQQEGWIPDFDETKFDGSLESIRDMMNQSLNKKFDDGISDYKNTIEPLTQRIQNALEAGISQEDIVDHFKDVKAFQKIDKTKLAENEDQLKTLYNKYYKATTKFSDDKITKLIDKKFEMQDFEDAEEVYDDYNKHLVESEKSMIETAEAEDKKAEEAQRNTVSHINKTIDESKEVLGVKVTPILRDQIKKEFQTVKTKDGRDVRPIVATREKNPLEFDIAVSIIHSLGLLNIDEKGKWTPDLSKIKNNMKSKVTKEMEEAFGNGKEIRTGKHLDLNGISGGNSQEAAKELEDFLDKNF